MAVAEATAKPVAEVPIRPERVKIVLREKTIIADGDKLREVAEGTVVMEGACNVAAKTLAKLLAGNRLKLA